MKTQSTTVASSANEPTTDDVLVQIIKQHGAATAKSAILNFAEDEMFKPKNYASLREAVRAQLADRYAYALAQVKHEKFTPEPVDESKVVAKKQAEKAAIEMAANDHIAEMQASTSAALRNLYEHATVGEAIPVLENISGLYFRVAQQLKAFDPSARWKDVQSFDAVEQA